MSTRTLEHLKLIWSKYLGPTLNPDANLVYMAMDTTARKQYSTLKEALYQHYRISQETYRAKMVQVRREAGESWTTCGNRYLNFCWKWVKDCSTLGDMVELSSIDAVTKLMPKPISNHVRDHAPTTLKEATKLADEFTLTRGWSLDQISDRRCLTETIERETIDEKSIRDRRKIEIINKKS